MDFVSLRLDGRTHEQLVEIAGRGRVLEYVRNAVLAALAENRVINETPEKQLKMPFSKEEMELIDRAAARAGLRGRSPWIRAVIREALREHTMAEDQATRKIKVGGKVDE